MKNTKHAAGHLNRHRDSSQGKLYISAGLPGAGKSTFLKANKAHQEVIVSRDEIRLSMLQPGEEHFSHEKEVFSVFTDKIAENLKEGKNVYADATHLNHPSQLKLLASVLSKAAPAEINYIYFNVPIDVCLERNEKRKGTNGYCPPFVIRKFKNVSDFTPCSYIDKAYEVNRFGTVIKVR